MQPARQRIDSAREVEHQNEKQKARLDEWNTLKSKLSRLCRQLGMHVSQGPPPPPRIWTIARGTPPLTFGLSQARGTPPPLPPPPPPARIWSAQAQTVTVTTCLLRVCACVHRHPATHTYTSATVYVGQLAVKLYAKTINIYMDCWYKMIQ